MLPYSRPAELCPVFFSLLLSLNFFFSDIVFLDGPGHI